jgi:two-component system, cell cycle response regulator DivK
MSEEKLGKIFIVEDNELNLKLFCDLLESCGYELRSTRIGEESIAMIREFIPDLILMDIQLRGISGIDIIKQIKDDQYIKHIPVIAVTAFAMKDDKDKIMASGCEGYIAKPIAIEPFLEKIASFIKK